MSNKILDLSIHNGTVNMEKVKQSGVYGIIQRVGYGSNTLDYTAYRNIDNALRVGLKVGVYWFMYSLNEEQALNESNNFHNYIEKYRGKLELPVFCDFEYDTERYAKQQGVYFTVDSRTKIIDTFCSNLERKGWYVGNYANVDYLRNKINYNKLKKYDLWLAQWDNKKSYDCGLWQYTSVGKVSGVTGSVDISLLYKDYPTIIKENNLNGYGKSKTVNTTNKELDKAITVIAKEVLKGTYGNGTERKEKLYKVIQDKVNTLI